MEESLKLLEYYKEKFDLEAVDANNLSPLILAYIGDSVYDTCVRHYVISHFHGNINKVNRKKVNMVCAKAQSDIVMHFLETDFLSEKEMDILRRGRNAKSVSRSKNASVQDYRRATGFEALIGYCYLMGEFERLIEIEAEGINYLCETENLH